MKKMLALLLLLLFSQSGLASTECQQLKEGGKWKLLKNTVTDVHFLKSPLVGCFAGFSEKGESVYRFGIFQQGMPAMILPSAGSFEKTNILSTNDAMRDILAVSFRDLNGDNHRDVLIFGIASGWGGDSNFALIYWGCHSGFVFDENLSSKISAESINDKEGYPKPGANITSVIAYIKRQKMRHICPS